jgi:RNA polymerase sigma factor (sigma-70 family)
MIPDASDRLLREYLSATTDSEIESNLARIVQEFAKPLISRIVGSALRGPSARDAEDLVSETVMHLIRRLREAKIDPANHAIRDFRRYVATAAYNGCHERLRERYPARNRLRNQLRYLLNHHSDFALWQAAQGQLVCGRGRWIGRPAGSAEWLQSSSFSARSDPSAANRAQITQLVAQILNEAQEPLELDSLLQAIARIIGLEEGGTELPLGGAEVAGDAAIDAQLELRMSLRQLWADIRELPLRQRVALLLSLRDNQGREILSLLPHTRISTIAEIAELLQIPLPKLAELWTALPLDDSTIGQLLGASKQQVIKLRRLARERLWRSSKRREQTTTIQGRQNVVPESASSKAVLATTRLGGTTGR